MDTNENFKHLLLLYSLTSEYSYNFSPSTAYSKPSLKVSTSPNDQKLFQNGKNHGIIYKNNYLDTSCCRLMWLLKKYLELKYDRVRKQWV